ncbi:hypothetical protein [Collinsella sp. An2]|uniref:hypothetical protein n=1 Tax=Collinsella sp. An2 TaxID=1965585 RepID=UPI0013023106|nr:hypothetical protein [Collinsella sp. An2]
MAASDKGATRLPGQHARQRGRAARRAVDIALAAGFSLVMATALVEDVAHEWIGIGVFLLVVTHQVLNRSWWRTLLRGRWSLRRVVSSAVDLCLVVEVLAMLASALVVSAHAFSWLPVIPGAGWARPAHLLGSYWGYVLVGLHTGFHVQPMFARAWRRGRCVRLALLACCAVVLLAGVWSFVTLDVGAYLTYSSPFVFVDFDTPFALRWVQWLAVGALYALAGSALWALMGGAAGRRRQSRA